MASALTQFTVTDVSPGYWRVTSVAHDCEGERALSGPTSNSASGITW